MLIFLHGFALGKYLVTCIRATVTPKCSIRMSINFETCFYLEQAGTLKGNQHKTRSIIILFIFVIFQLNSVFIFVCDNDAIIKLQL